MCKASQDAFFRKIALEMTVALNNILKSAGIGVTPKAPVLDRTIYGESTGSGGYHPYHSYGSNKGGGKHSIALTALTLLAFLFFLNILQNCIQEQTDNHSTPQVMVLSSRIKQPREAEKRKGTETEGDSEVEVNTEQTNGDEDETDEKTYLKIAKRILETENVPRYSNGILYTSFENEDENIHEK